MRNKNTPWKICIVVVSIIVGILGAHLEDAQSLTRSFSNISFNGLLEKRSQSHEHLRTPSHSTHTHAKPHYSKLPPVPNPLHNFQEAKRAAKHIFEDHPKTFYCGCKFDKHNKVNLESCGYLIQHDKRRAKRLEWEHIVPMSHLAANLPCWKQLMCCNKKGECFKGRRCCQEIDSNFSKMEADLHNLVPEIGELNALRSNYRFGVLPAFKTGQFGTCEMKIDQETRRVEPSVNVRGMIARAYLYMASTYDFYLSDNQKQLFQAWNVQHPPNSWEIEWDKRIFFVQGNHNPYISHYNEMKKDIKNEMKPTDIKKTKIKPKENRHIETQQTPQHTKTSHTEIEHHG